MTDHPLPDLAEVRHAIEEAHEAEDRLHQMAPYQLQTPDDYVPNGFDPHDHRPDPHEAAARPHPGQGSPETSERTTDPED